MINESLEKLGFSPEDAAVFLAIQKEGKALPAQIARLTGLNRSTVYSVAGELKKRGVIAEDLGGKVRYLVALPPADLSQLGDAEEARLKDKRRVIAQAVEELQEFVGKPSHAIPKIIYLTEKEIEPYLRKRAKEWNESIMASDGVWWGFQDHTFVQAYGAWIDWFWRSAAPPTLSLKLLSNRSETERMMRKKGFERREIRFWKESKDFSATVWVNGEYLVMITTREHPYSLVEIHDTTLAANMRTLFKGIWKNA